MGAYLSKPVTEKVSSDDSNGILQYGASSMQGWRVYQEDAHNAILDFDTNCSLFAIYDGHGGHEVATYTSAELPNFIKDTDAFKKEQYSQALSDAFLEFDASLVQPKVLTVLKELAGSKDKEDSDYDGEEVDHLCREAAMPLEEVMAKYFENPHQFQSPNVRRQKEIVGCSSSVEGCSYDIDGLDEFQESDPKDETSAASSSNLSSSLGENPEEKESSLSSSSPKQEISTNPKESSSNSSLLNGLDKEKSEAEALNGECESEMRVNEKIKDEGGGPTENKDGDAVNEKPLSPGGKEVKEEINGEMASKTPSGKGKGNAKGKGILNSAMVHAMRMAQRRERKRRAAQVAEVIYQHMQEGKGDDEDLSDEDEEDEEDDSFEGVENCHGADDTSSSEDDDSDVEDENEEEEEEEEEENEGEDNQYHEFSMNMREEPGFDSGCTACVALLKGRCLYVANVGDSRCIVCRRGKALDMSVDHKPEDELEATRITKAGGRITSDGRVNGGLNLSRALGDHSYKQNKNQDAADQMISPLPDVRSLTLTDEDYFLVIACDGIWNSMSSQEVCDFVAERIGSCNKISCIAEEMFDHCLSPDAHGDGTGCDNMTCIVVKLSDLSVLDSSDGGKRGCDSSEKLSEEEPSKRCRLDETQ